MRRNNLLTSMLALMLFSGAVAQQTPSIAKEKPSAQIAGEATQANLPADHLLLEAKYIEPANDGFWRRTNDLNLVKFRLVPPAHCFCTLGPPSSPIKNFGEIDSYNTQIGHGYDDRCRTKCNGTTESYMSNASSRASACNAANGVSVVTYSSVGSKKYITGTSFSCPQTSSGPERGSITFPASRDVSNTRKISVNDTEFFPPGQPIFLTPIKTSYVTFKLEDQLEFHMQAWTYDATLYRDGVLVERLSGKASGVSKTGVSAIFTSQPTNSVRGHTWKITWHYTGKGLADGDTSFVVP